ncbi:MAG: hypothetical protein AAGC46_20250 [Solirubrobacteraceae bacterium]|nr:EVE domain-containing protein [Patulibacter sp.]
MSPVDPGRPGGDADPVELSELLADLQATAEQLGSQLGDLGRFGAGAAASRAENLPAVRRLMEIAPPELRGRLTAAAAAGLSATRDLADWLLAQVSPEPVRVEPEELPITRVAPPRIEEVPTTWILTASVENHLATEAHGFSVIGIKERNRNRALEIEIGDQIVFYLTKVMSFAGAVRVTGDLFEDREKIWPGQPRNPDAYPWRMATENLVALPREAWIPAERLKDDLEHVQKWPAEHWKLAFQGQLRVVSDHDTDLLMGHLNSAAAAVA